MDSQCLKFDKYTDVTHATKRRFTIGRRSGTQELFETLRSELGPSIPRTEGFRKRTCGKPCVTERQTQSFDVFDVWDKEKGILV